MFSRFVFLALALCASAFFTPLEAPLPHVAPSLLSSSSVEIIPEPSRAVPLEKAGVKALETPGILSFEAPGFGADETTVSGVFEPAASGAFETAEGLLHEDAAPTMLEEPSSVALATPPADSRWSWPCDGPTRVLRAYDPPSLPWLAGHRGVDLDLPLGSIIRAPAPGTVLVAGTIVDRPVISIQHGRLRSTFEAVEPLVLPGQLVARGEPIGILSEGSHTPGLHWGAKLSAKEYVNPLRLLIGEVVLWPWEG